ncbi:MAG: Tetraacyldisaccharide 4'-kinase (EC [uncultured Thiotrichaceae bacterium]|uniref:Tetraacyldisaccharide 4'-kinase n=1 Tax=uncultured Thiotrichaceae bacterium TaxID=298394 RepID=A0A6S6TK04_9GAMM|nr:MAG: Tetraacyldisaccharide 4'-kinase (EC [uncultured Thiotrichaceae bacterium]
MPSPNTKHHIPRLQQWLETIWYEQHWKAMPLLPLSALFCGISAWRKRSQIKHQRPSPIPVIVIGNISIGGTGKTPLIIHLVSLLQAAGYRPAIISRGYKGTSSVWPLLVNVDTLAQVCGDEAKLLSNRTGVPVIVGANRVEDIQYAHSHTDANIILSDDGLQHYKMAREYEIVVVDGKRGLGNRYCLPAGPLRESPSRLESCDLAISNGQSELTQHHMHVSGNIIRNIRSGKTQSLTGLSQAHLVTGIGNPQRFIDTLREHHIELLSITTFPDHHDFISNDFSQQNGIPTIMTEKDAVKCQDFEHDNLWYLEVDAYCNESFDIEFLEALKHITHE